MCKVIAVVNQKGGVGKSTTVVNLGVGLAMSGERVLAIDSDPQGNLTSCFGVESSDVTLSTILRHIISKEKFPLDKGIIKTNEGVDLMPANIQLSDLQVALVNAENRETILNQYLEKIKDNYDYILIDCMPSLEVLTMNVLACADSILIPVQAAYLATLGLQQLISTIGKAKRRINRKLEFEGILITMFDKRTRTSREIDSELREAYGNHIRVFCENIPRSVRVEESADYGKSIFAYDPRGKVAPAYMSLVKEVLANE